MPRKLDTKYKNSDSNTADGSWKSPSRN
jgi:hypothetical protein